MDVVVLSPGLVVGDPQRRHAESAIGSPARLSPTASSPGTAGALSCGLSVPCTEPARLRSGGPVVG